MTQDIKNIQTPVHVLIELEFSFVNVLLKNMQGQEVGNFRYPINNDIYSAAFEPLKTLDIRSARAFVWPKMSALVPNEFYTESHKAQFLEKLYSGVDKTLVKTDHLDTINATHVFGIPPNQQLALLTLFPGIKIQSTITSYLQYILDVSNHKNAVFSHQLSDRVWIVIILSLIHI